MVLTVSACANLAPSRPSLAVDVPTASSTAPVAAPSPAPPHGEMSPRKNLVKKVGETADWGIGNNNISVKFVVDKITVDPKCTSQFAGKPQNGHLVQMDVRVETTPDMPTNTGYSINPYSFSAIGPDGVTEPSVVSGVSFSCLAPNTHLPAQFAPASKYRGSLVLDVSSPTGTLIFSPSFSGAGGWEWAFPAAG
ncbi:hypothetical protein [Pseudonocardia sp. GCM10023141]|uniref:hypothetical protein n=1 Tax=Pseudonocardia sp. GCM10023141 TaxID=3252653 RepID=UPI0036150333